MPNERRLRANSIGGLIEDNPLTAAATTLNSAALATLPVVDTTNHCAIVLDPDGIEGAPEIAYITAHAASATSATILRAQEGTSALQRSQDIPWVHAPTIKDYDGSGGGSGLIGITSYNPASTGTTVTSSTYVDVDATNLVVAFTVPPSGRVLVGLSGGVSCVPNTTIGWGIREGTTTVVSGEVLYNFGGNVSLVKRYLVTGLTPGAALSYKWAHARTFGSGTISTNYGGVHGPAVMEVWAVNL